MRVVKRFVRAHSSLASSRVWDKILLVSQNAHQLGATELRCAYSSVLK